MTHGKRRIGPDAVHLQCQLHPSTCSRVKVSRGTSTQPPERAAPLPDGEVRTFTYEQWLEGSGSSGGRART
ncbi:hypothetical protein ACRAWD_12555 [Caulobacter segnis]